MGGPYGRNMPLEEQFGGHSRDLPAPQVQNTSLDLLPLWLVSGVYAYSFEAVCPPASSQPGSEVLVHIPKRGWGLVKRGSLIEETLSPRFLQVHQSDSFTVTEDRDFVIVSIPSARLLQVQPCQEAGETPGTQAFYRVDVSLAFAETVSPVHWTVENFFQCVGSREELLVSASTPETTSLSLSPGREIALAAMPSAASSQFQNTRLAALEELSQGHVHLPAEKPSKPRPAPFLQTTRLTGGSQGPTAWLSPRTTTDQHGSQTAPEKAGLPPPPWTSATLSSEPVGAVQAGHTASHPVFLAPTSLTTHLSSEISSPGWPSWRPDGSKMLLGSGRSVALTEGPGAPRAEQDPTQPPGRPPLLEVLSQETVASSVEPVSGEPARISEEFWPSMGASVSGLAERGVVSHHFPRMPQEITPTVKAERPPQSDYDPSRQGTKGYLDLLLPEPNQGMEGLELTIQPGTDTTFVTPKRRQPEANARLGTSGPEPPRIRRVGPAVSLTTFPSKKPTAPCEGESDRTPHPASAATWPEGWHEWGVAHIASPLPSDIPSFPAPEETMVPTLGEPGTPFPDGQGVSPQQEPMESMLTPTPVHGRTGL